MKRFLGAVLVTALVSAPALADDQDVKTTLDKGVKALGGEEALAKVKAATWKSKGIITFNGDDNPITLNTTYQGLDKHRAEFEGEFNGMAIKGVTILNGDKAWRKFGDMDVTDIDKDGVANEKRNLYLQVVPITLAALKGKDFKVEAAGEEKVGDKPAAVLKVTGPDGKDFKLAFDKETGLPVRLTAKVIGFMGEDYVQETTYSDYKDFAGIKKATKVVSKRDGEKFVTSEVSDFKVLDKVDAKSFDAPE